MPIDQLANYAEVFGAVAVIVSLIYLAFQVRANTREQTSRRLQERAAITSRVSGLVMENKDVRQALLKANGSLDQMTPEDVLIFNAWVRQLLLLAQTVHLNAPRTGLPERDSISMLSRALLGPAVSRWWALIKSDYSPEFVAFVDRLREWGIGEGLDRSLLDVIGQQVEAENDH